ncbi:hypothetical protein M0K88_004881 [Escherichia coli]|nr:conjugal transfer protein TraM [Escherichia coli]
MSDAVEELVKEIAAKHGISVGRDDPILVLHTINERLMQHSRKAQEAILDSFKEELESIAFRWGEDAKAKAERILSAGLNASRDVMNQAMKDTAKTMTDTIRTEVDAALKRSNAPLLNLKHITTMMALGSCLTFAAALIVFWVAIKTF